MAEEFKSIIRSGLPGTFLSQFHPERCQPKTTEVNGLGFFRLKFIGIIYFTLNTIEPGFITSKLNGCQSYFCLVFSLKLMRQRAIMNVFPQDKVPVG